MNTLLRCGSIQFSLRPVAPILLIAMLTACQPGVQQTDQLSLVELLPGYYIGESDGAKIFHKIAPITAPRLGEVVFYHQISREGFDGAPMQQKIYIVASGGKRMRSLVVAKDNEKYRNLEQQVMAAFRLRADLFLQFPDVCDFVWTQQQGSYVGRVEPDICEYESPAFGEPISPEMTYQLNESEFKLTETLFRADGQALFPTINIVSERVGRRADETK